MTRLWNYRPHELASVIEIGRLETIGPISQTVHFHSEVQVASVTCGWRSYSTPLGDLYASAGDVVVIPAYVPHASRGVAAAIVTHLYIPSDHASVFGLTTPRIIRCGAHSPAELVDAVGSVRAGERSERPRTTVPRHLVGEERDIGSIAAQLGYSTDGFIRAFRRQFGMTPAAYRLAYRLMIARTKLRRGDSVAGVAHATSFADQSHFGRLFRRAYGATPAAYRSAFAAR